MKKINFYFALAIMMMIVASCSSGGSNSKEIQPTSTEFTSGELAKYVEFVDEPCVLTFSEKDGTIPSQTMRLKTKMKKIKEGFEDVDYHDISITSLFAGAIVNLVDESGATIQDLNLSSEGALALKKLLSGKVGDVAEVTFEDTFFNSEDSPKWYKGTSAFSPYLSGDISVGNQSVSTSSANEVATKAVEESEPEESDFPIENVILPSSLKGKVEVTSVEKGISRYGYPEVTITFKLLKKVNTASLCSEGGQMWIVGVGQNEQGRDVKELLPNYGEWRSGDSDGSEFKDFLEGDPDDTITLEFSGDKDSSNDVEADLEKVKKFKLKLNK